MPPAGTRDERADIIDALKAEYESYVGAFGMADKAAEVAAVLRAYGHEVRPQKPVAGQKERAVSAEQTERAVDGESVKKRPAGRPRKTAE